MSGLPAAPTASWPVPRAPLPSRAPQRPPPPGLLGTLGALLRVLVVGIFLLTFLAQPYRIPSASMVPTLLVGDFVLVSKCAFGPRASGRGPWAMLERYLLPPAQVRRGDLAVFHFPPDPRRDLVKRVIALPGDRIRLHEGLVYLNDRRLREPYTLYTQAAPELFRDEFPDMREADPNIDPHWWMALRHSTAGAGDLQVPPGDFFVLGDNRNNSEDSRFWGFVPQALLIGQPILVYFAVPDGADAPAGVAARFRWVFGWARGRMGVPK